jgi:hypothetical protein
LPRGRVEHTRGPRRPRGTLVQGLAVAACAALAAAVVSACAGSSDDDAAPQTESGTAPTESVDSAKSRILEEQSFSCTGKVDLDLVRVTMRKVVDDAISLGENCTGRIGRIEVETWTADGIKVQNFGKVAHDLVIESGFVKCHDVFGEYHQDGIQVMGGRAITFRGLRVDCLGNSNLFLSEGGQRASTPTDVVCEGCVLGPNSGQTLFYAPSLRSGARNTTICTGRFRAIRVEPGAQEMVDAGNEVLPHDDPSCADVTGKGAATAGSAG